MVNEDDWLRPGVGGRSRKGDEGPQPLEKGKRRDTAGQLRDRVAHSIGSSNAGWCLGNPSAQLSGDRNGGEMIAANWLGMPKNEAPAQCGGDQQDEGNGGQAVLGTGCRWPD